MRHNSWQILFFSPNATVIEDFDEDKWAKAISELEKGELKRETATSFVKAEYSLSVQGDKFALKIKELIK